MRELTESRQFHELYRRELEPLEREFEEHRANAARERTRRVAAAVLLWCSALAMVVVWMRPASELAWWLFGFFMLVAAILLGIWAFVPIMAHYGRLKEQIVPRIVPLFGDLRYVWDAPVAVSSFARSRALPRFNKEYVEDLVEGSHRGVPLRALEISLSYESRTSRAGGGSTTRVDRVFKGLLVEMLTGADYPGVTVLGTEGTFDGYFTIDEATGLRRAQGADGFDIYTTVSLTLPHPGDAELRRRLSAVARVLDAGRIVGSLAGDRVVLLIERSTDLFEISTRKKTDFRRDAEKIGEQLKALLSIVETLDLSPPIRRTGWGEPSESKETAQPSRVLANVNPRGAETDAADRYSFGTWGCFGVAAWTLLSIAGFGWVLRTRAEGDALFGWSALGGFLASMGLYQGFDAFRRRSTATAIAAALLLGGAVWILRRQLG